MPFISDAEYQRLLEASEGLTSEARIERGLDDLTSLDQKLINYAGVLSPVKISELTGIPAEEVARRTTEILSSIDYFEVEQMRKKQHIMLNTLITEAMNRLPSVSDKVMPGFLNSTGGNIYRALKELEELEKRAEKNSTAMEQAYAKRMVDIVSRAFDRYLGKLSILYSDVDPSEIATGFQACIMEIAREIDAEGR